MSLCWASWRSLDIQFLQAQNQIITNVHFLQKLIKFLEYSLQLPFHQKHSHYIIFWQIRASKLCFILPYITDSWVSIKSLQWDDLVKLYCIIQYYIINLYFMQKLTKIPENIPQLMSPKKSIKWIYTESGDVDVPWPQTRIWVNQWLHFPLSTMYSPLLLAAIHPNDYISSMEVTLACYQQAGNGGKYIGISGKWRCWFTLTLQTNASF